ncbi:MAG: hypothetical protein SF051_06530 [Elusimicrobiota bacterium]|nr:hypothetical protein [Elusimicrobiota bacterium]
MSRALVLALLLLSAGAPAARAALTTAAPAPRTWGQFLARPGISGPHGGLTASLAANLNLPVGDARVGLALQSLLGARPLPPQLSADAAPAAAPLQDPAALAAFQLLAPALPAAERTQVAEAVAAFYHAKGADAARLIEEGAASWRAPAMEEERLVAAGGGGRRNSWTRRLASLGRPTARAPKAEAAVPAPRALGVAAPLDLTPAPSDAPVARPGRTAANDARVVDAELAALVEEMKTWRAERNQSEQITLEAIERFLDRYQQITGRRPVFAENAGELMRDHGDALLEMRERRFLIGMVGFSGRKSDEAATQEVWEGAVESLIERGVSPEDIALVGGFTNLGSIKAGYEAGRKFPGVELQGISSAKSMDYVTAMVQKALLVGREFGTESPVFLDLIDFVIGTGGGGQGEKELRWMASNKADNTFIVKGILEIKPDGSRVPGAADKIEASAGGHHLEAEGGAWRALGARIGRMMHERAQDMDLDRAESPLSRLAMRSAPSDLSELESYAQAKVGRFRVIRLVDALRKRLETAKVPPSDAARLQLDAAKALDAGLVGIDNFGQNARWQAAAKAALASAGEAVRAIVEAGELDSSVLFASWFGVRDSVDSSGSGADLDLSVFDEESPLPRVTAPSAKDATFDLADYAELRLDVFTRTLLAAQGAAPEIFLGSQGEMNAYYRRRGYPRSRQVSDSNGTNYFLFQGEGRSLAVVQGVDSQARLAHLTALMQARGVDTGRMLVRGSMTRLRRNNRNTLELALMDLGLTGRIAGVVVGDKNNSGLELARRAGATPEALRRGRTVTIGPFRFDAYKVAPTGRGEPQFILAFAPAYGELSEDLVSAAYSAGARNFMIAGAGGTLRPDEKAGVVHNVVSSEYEGERIDLREVKGVEIVRARGGTDAHNATTTSPLIQTPAWAQAQRDAGTSDADQETFHIFRGLRDAIAEETERSGPAGTAARLQVGLHQSDAVGSNGLAAGTVDAAYGPSVQAMFSQFLDRLGVGAVLAGESVEGRDGESFAVSDAVPGLLAASPRRAPAPLADALPVRDASTVWANGLGGTIRQMKGQKRFLFIESGRVGPDERRALRRLLSEVEPDRFWVALRQDDPNFVQLLSIAREAGIETVTLERESTGPHGRFIIRAADAAQMDALAVEMTRSAKADEYEPNIAQHYRVGLGRDGGLLTVATDGQPTSVVAADADPKAADAAVTAAARRVAQEAGANDRSVRSAITRLLEKAGRRAPRFLAREEVGAFLAGRQPVLWSGASRKSWPEVTPDNQELVRQTIVKLLSRLDPKRHVIVTGGTDFGVEAIVHQEAAARGFELMATITENTKAEEVSPKVTAVVQYAISWFGKSRPVLMELVKAHGGFVIFQGGGAILAEEIELAVRLQVPVFLQRGPEGAAAVSARRYPHLAFTAFEDLADTLFGPNGVSVNAAGRSLDADAIRDAATRPGFEPVALIRALKRDPYLRRQFESRIGAWEGFTLERHTLMNMSQFERYWGGKTGVAGFDSGDMRLFLALHDIGRIKADENAAALRAELLELEKTDKPEATRRWPEIAAEAKRQHEYTEQVMRAYLPRLGYTESKIAAFVALAHHDPIGPMARPNSTLTAEAAIADIRAGAAAAGLPEADFFRLVKPFYFSDAGAYTVDAGGNYVPETVYKAEGHRSYTRDGDRLFGPSLDGVFTFDRSAGRVDFSPAVEARVRPLLETFEGPLLRLANGAVLDRATVGRLRTALSGLDRATLAGLAQAARGTGFVPAALRPAASAAGLMDRGLSLTHEARAVLLSGARSDGRGGAVMGVPAVGTPGDGAPVRMAALRDGAHFPLAAVEGAIVGLKALHRDDPRAFAALRASLASGRPVAAPLRARLAAFIDDDGLPKPLTRSVLNEGFQSGGPLGFPRWPNPIDRLYDPAPRR